MCLDDSVNVTPSVVDVTVRGTIYVSSSFIPSNAVRVTLTLGLFLSSGASTKVPSLAIFTLVAGNTLKSVSWAAL